MFQQALRLTLAGALAWSAFTGAATAASLTVTSLDDSGAGTLREALVTAEGNGEADTIDFTVSGSIDLASTLPTITTDVEVLGPGAAQLTISGSDLVRVFRVAGGQVTIRDLTVASGLARGGDGGMGSSRGGGGGGGLGAGGGLLSENADLVLVGVVFDGNRAVGGNGGAGDTVVAGVGGLGAIGGTSSVGPAGGAGAGSAGNGGGGGGAGGGFTDGGDGIPGNIGGGGGWGGSRMLIGGFSDVGNGSGGSGAGCGGGSGDLQTPGDFAGDGGIGIANCVGNGGGGGGGGGLGGGLYLRSGTLSLTDVSFFANEARRGAGGVGGSGGGDGQGKGGALFVDRDGTVLALSNLVRTGNVADDDTAVCHDDDGVFSRGTWVQPLEPPTDLALDVTEVNEGLAAGSIVGNLATTDPSPADAHAYALVPGAGSTDNALFQVVGDQLVTAAVLDHETQPTLSVRLRTTDGCGAAFERAVVITVLDVDEPPVAADDAFGALEDHDLIVPAPGLLGNDVDPEEVGLAVDAVVTPPTNGTLIGGLAVDGSFTYRPGADFNGTDTFTYRATDGLATSNVATVTITIDPVNDAPSFSITSLVSVDQDLGAQTVAGFAFDLSPGPADEAGQSLAFSVTGNTDPALFSDQPALSAAGTLTFTSAPGAVGTATITVELMDDGGTANGGQDTSPPQAFDLEIRDAVAPEVVAVDATPGGSVAACTELRSPTSALVVTFSEAMADPPGNGGLGDVTNPASYRLIAAGADGDLSSTSCSAVAGDDVLRPIAGVTFDGPSLQATLSFSPHLSDRLYRLVICDSLGDLAGNGLAADVAVTFRQTAQNRFANGNVDCDLGGWVLASTVPEEIAYSTEDVDDATLSGSIHVTNLSGTAFSVGQCVDADVPAYRLGGHIRLDGAADVQLEVAMRCHLFDQAACAGSSLGESTDAVVLGETAGLWQPIATSFAADGAASGLCSVDLSLLAGSVFDAFLDRLTLPGNIFADGFESGDVSAWSGSIGVP